MPPPGWRRYLPQLVALAVGLVAVLVIRAVVRDDDSGSAQPTTTAAPVDAADDGGDEGEPPRTTLVRPEAEPLGRVVLRVEDLPDGWRTAPPASTTEVCPGEDPFASAGPAQRTVVFQASPRGPFLASTVADLEDEAVAADLLAALEDAVEACRTYEDQGTRYELQPRSVGGVGDASAGARLRGSSEVGELQGLLAFARVEDRVVAVTLIAIGQTADEDLVEDALEAVVERL